MLLARHPLGTVGKHFRDPSHRYLVQGILNGKTQVHEITKGKVSGRDERIDASRRRSSVCAPPTLANALSRHLAYVHLWRERRRKV